MENWEFPAQSNLKPLRFLSFPFFFSFTHSVPTVYFQAPVCSSVDIDGIIPEEEAQGGPNKADDP